MAKSPETILFQCDVADGVIGIQLSKVHYDDADVASIRWHRATIAPGDDAEAILAANSADLIARGFSAISDEDLATIRAYVALNGAP